MRALLTSTAGPLSREVLMRRRDVMKALATAPAFWSVGASAQKAERLRRIGVLVSAPADDREYVTNLNVFRRRLEELGWSEGRNVQIDVRWGGGQARVHRSAGELVGLAPDVIVAPGSASAGPALQATRSIPIIFMIVPIRSVPV